LCFWQNKQGKIEKNIFPHFSPQKNGSFFLFFNNNNNTTYWHFKGLRGVKPFFFLQICDIKIFAKNFQKYIAKLFESSLEKPKTPDFLSKKNKTKKNRKKLSRK